MLVLYGLFNVYLIAFFSSFTLISTGYLIGSLFKRRYSRTRPVTRDRWAIPLSEAAGFKSLAKDMGN
jgi:hypothetical protein